MPYGHAPNAARQSIAVVTEALMVLETAQEGLANLVGHVPPPARASLTSAASALETAVQCLTEVIAQKPLAARGALLVLCGPMYAGKTRELLHRIRQADLAGRRTVLVVPPAASGIGVAKSRDGGAMPATVAETALGMLVAAENANVVFIDEAQMFPAVDLAEGIDGLLGAGKEVVAAGLDLDAFGAPFGGMPWALAAAGEVIKLKAVCARCGAPASRTQRIACGEAVLAGPVVAADAEYEPRCSACWVAANPPSR